MDQRRRRNTQAGITLIEMLVVVVIIGLFAGLVGTNLWKRADQAKVTATRTQIETFMNALGQYKLDTGTFPTTEQGLRALREKPSDSTQWAGPYLVKDLPKDAWEHDYAYKYPSEHGDEPEIISYGQDGQPGGEKEAADIVSWKSR